MAGKTFGVSHQEKKLSKLLWVRTSMRHQNDFRTDKRAGSGVQAVIVKSFAFIYSRNQPSLGLLGIVIEDEAFYEAATDNALLTIDIQNRNIRVGEESNVKECPFNMPEMEYRLRASRRINAAYGKFKNRVGEHMVGNISPQPKAEETAFDVFDKIVGKTGGVDSRLQW